jgi:alpha-tubulin suppressor-like RCC1 family protein
VAPIAFATALLLGLGAAAPAANGSTAWSPPTVTDVSVARGQDTCAVTGSGGVKCWGMNGWGQLGIGAQTTFIQLPVDVSGLDSGVASVGVGNEFACALTEAGGVKCWGLNEQGQLGAGTADDLSTTPVDVQGLSSGV